jgi:hypothetical protein
MRDCEIQTRNSDISMGINERFLNSYMESSSENSLDDVD